MTFARIERIRRTKYFKSNIVFRFFFFSLEAGSTFRIFNEGLEDAGSSSTFHSSRNPERTPYFAGTGIHPHVNEMR